MVAHARFGAEQAKYRCHWTPPLAIDPFDHNTVYYGCQVIFRTSNGGNSWNVISPDLSTAGPQPHRFLRRNRRRQSRPVLRRSGVLDRALGSSEGPDLGRHQRRQGLVHEGCAAAHWNDVTKNIAGLPAWGVVSKIEPSHFDAGTAYIAVDFHLMDNRDPLLLQDHRFRQDLDQDQRQPAQGSAGLCARDRRESE